MQQWVYNYIIMGAKSQLQRMNSKVCFYTIAFQLVTPTEPHASVDKPTSNLLPNPNSHSDL